MNVKPVWQMVLEAAKAIGSDIINISEIRHYILTRYSDVNIGTINCQIIVCCVNRQSRINYFENLKPRVANGQYDFLYYVDRGQVALYKPDIHGRWEIASVNGKLIVRQLDGNMDIKVSYNDVSVRTSIPSSVSQKIIRADIPRPSSKEVAYYLKRWDSLGHYTAQESALNKLFWQLAPANSLLDDVLLKVVALNTFYSTNIKSVFTVAHHIYNLKIDERLKSGDETLVEEIACVTMSNGKVRNEFSFATKYCSHHNADAYPIYDSYVEKLLCYLRDIDGFAEFHKDELRRFTIFKKVILKIREFYSLEAFTIKEIDKYLWQLGKEKFPKNYGKSQNKNI